MLTRINLFNEREGTWFTSLIFASLLFVGDYFLSNNLSYENRHKYLPLQALSAQLNCLWKANYLFEVHLILSLGGDHLNFRVKDTTMIVTVLQYYSPMVHLQVSPSIKICRKLSTLACVVIWSSQLLSSSTYRTTMEMRLWCFAALFIHKSLNGTANELRWSFCFNAQISQNCIHDFRVERRKPLLKFWYWNEKKFKIPKKKLRHPLSALSAEATHNRIWTSMRSDGFMMTLVSIIRCSKFW